MDNIIIIGGGGHARMIVSLLRKIGTYRISGYTALQESSRMPDIPYLGPDEILPGHIQDFPGTSAVIGVGLLTPQDTKKRKHLENNLQNWGYRLPPIISTSAVVNEGVLVADAALICDSATIITGTTIGRNVIINTSASIDHDCTIGNQTHIAPGVTLGGGVTIGSDCFLGIGTVMIQNIQVSDGCFFTAGSVVTKNCESAGLYGGLPARMIRRLFS